jgi:sigma-B regulation protein RsbU (phosphoserine phosphatase)
VEIDLRCDVRVVLDEERFEQVLVNLLANAMRYGSPERPVTLRADRRDHTLVVAVHNEGPPIAPAVLPHLFEPFRRGSASAPATSTGLGLFIVSEIVRAHGGRVSVRSTAREGTTFTLWLPQPPRDDRTVSDDDARGRSTSA